MRVCGDKVCEWFEDEWEGAGVERCWLQLQQQQQEEEEEEEEEEGQQQQGAQQEEQLGQQEQQEEEGKQQQQLEEEEEEQLEHQQQELQEEQQQQRQRQRQRQINSTHGAPAPPTDQADTSSAPANRPPIGASDPQAALATPAAGAPVVAPAMPLNPAATQEPAALTGAVTLKAVGPGKAPAPPGLGVPGAGSGGGGAEAPTSVAASAEEKEQLQSLLDWCVREGALRHGDAAKYRFLFHRQLAPADRQVDLEAMQAWAAEGQWEVVATCARISLALRAGAVGAQA